MKKKELKEKVEGLRKYSNTLTGTAKEFADAVVAAFDEAAADGQEEYGIADLKEKVSELAARFENLDAELKEMVARAKQDMLMQLQNTTSGDVKGKFTKEVKNAVTRLLLEATGMREITNGLDKIAAENGIEVRKKNGVSGLTYAEMVDYALQLQQEDSDEIFDALRVTNRNKWFYGELDAKNVKHIAKQWNGVTEEQATKLIQELTLEGKTISTAYIYKMQQVDNADLDDARDAGQEAELENDLRNELSKAVKALIVRAIMVGDTYNGNGSKVTVFETIGSKTETDLFTTVIAPAIAGTITLADVRKAAAAVKTERKWLVVPEELKLALATRKYAEGGTEFFFTDAELAAQLGVDKIVAKDFVSEVSGLHAIVFDPSEYWRKEKNVIDVAFPDYRNNTRGYIYEKNTGGAIHGLKSTAILKG